MRLEEPYIVVKNECSEKVNIHSIEVNYYIVVSVRSKRDDVLEERGVRKEVTERISVDSTLAPGGEARVYFGSVKSITSVNVILRIDDKLYKVNVPLTF